MAGHNIFSKMGLVLALDDKSPVRIPDPGDGGTLALNPNLGFQICVCDSSGSDTRVIPEPSNFSLGSVVLIVGRDVDTSGTDIDFETADSVQFTTTATEDVMTLDTDGQSFSLVVASSNGTKQWRLLHNEGGTLS